jgi:SAM-dependent methyltransferase
MALRARDWDRRYTGNGPAWNLMPPHPLVVEELTRLPAARAPEATALDLGAGTGRHSLWLAERGWEVTAVDFSATALAHARARAAEQGAAVHTVEADLATYRAQEAGYRLVLISYVHPGAADRAAMLANAAQALAPGGVLVVVGHHLDNMGLGMGPSDPALMYTPDRLVAEVPGLHVERAERVPHGIGTEQGHGEAYAVVLRAVRLPVTPAR